MYSRVIADRIGEGLSVEKRFQYVSGKQKDKDGADHTA